MSNVRSEDRISAEKLRTRLKLDGRNESLQHRKLHWFGHVERMQQCLV